MHKIVITCIGLLFFSLAMSQTEIFSTDFQSGIPANFAIVDNDGFTPELVVSEFTTAWIPYVDPENTNDSVAASTSYFNPPNTASRWLITPPLVLGSYGNFIEWQAKSHDASYPDDYLVLISTTNNALSSFTDTVGYIIEENFEWVTRQINLSEEGYNNQTVYVAFVNVTEDGFKLYLDDMRAWIEDPVHVPEITTIDFDIYPNPVLNTLVVKTDSDMDYLEVMNPSGSIILSSTDKVNNLEALPSGVYFVRIVVEDQLITKRIIKL
jgi:hypothetical protein